MSRTTNLTTKTLSLFLLFSSVGYAQTQYDEDGNRIVYESQTVIDFEAMDVSGELIRPEGSMILDRRRASFNPLIRLRTDFNEEMAESVDEVK